MQLSMYYHLGDDLWLRLVHILYTLIPRLSAHDRNGEILGEELSSCYSRGWYGRGTDGRGKGGRVGVEGR